MRNMRHIFLLPLVCFILALTARAQESEVPKALSAKAQNMSDDQLLTQILGKWKGICRTWFEPDKLADEAEVAGEFVSVLGGRFVRHTYEGTIQGKPRQGEELLAFNSVTKSFQSSWIDDFHMNYAIMFSQGPPTAQGFSVRGDYDVGENQPPWGWRTEYQLIDENKLTITAYNIAPDGPEAKAVEVIYKRITGD